MKASLKHVRMLMGPSGPLLRKPHFRGTRRFVTQIAVTEIAMLCLESTICARNTEE